MATLMSNDDVDGTHSVFSDHTYYGKLENRESAPNVAHMCRQEPTIHVDDNVI